MKEPMTDAKEKTTLQDKKTKKKKTMYKSRSSHGSTVFFWFCLLCRKQQICFGWMTVTGWRMQNSHTVDREERHGQIRKKHGEYSEKQMC